MPFGSERGARKNNALMSRHSAQYAAQLGATAEAAMRILSDA
jgi:hypothetical protein